MVEAEGKTTSKNRDRNNRTAGLDVLIDMNYYLQYDTFFLLVDSSKIQMHADKISFWNSRSKLLYGVRILAKKIAFWILEVLLNSFAFADPLRLCICVFSTSEHFDWMVRVFRIFQITSVSSLPYDVLVLIKRL